MASGLRSASPFVHGSRTLVGSGTTIGGRSDEPFGSLDAQTRSSLQELLVQIWIETKKTVVFVTHSVREATYLSDRVLVMSPRPGRITENIKIDLPRPRNALSVDFLNYERKVAETLANHTGQTSGQPAWITD